ncbi:MAG: hypothetical protein NTU60_01615 [Candidatus Aminicenantes bacterium]|nr:hypothetical protein [Candidatus Aminicenantes bacterium]
MLATLDPEGERFVPLCFILDNQGDIDEIHRPDGRRGQEEPVSPRVEFLCELTESDGIVHGFGLFVKAVIPVAGMVSEEDLIKAKGLGGKE